MTLCCGRDHNSHRAQELADAAQTTPWDDDADGALEAWARLGEAVVFGPGALGLGLAETPPEQRAAHGFASTVSRIALGGQAARGQVAQNPRLQRRQCHCRASQPVCFALGTNVFWQRHSASHGSHVPLVSSIHV